MTLQDVLNDKQDKLRRYLFDKRIQITGREYKAVHITKQDLDYYGDVLPGGDTFEDWVPIVLSINYPDEIPMDRFRYSSSASSSERLEIGSSGTFFFDVLPIEIFSKFSDKIETGDFLFHIAEDEVGNKIICVLQTSEFLGSLGKSLVWKKHYASPFKGSLSQKIIDHIEELLA